MDTVVELEGVNGEWFTLTGDAAGDRGVILDTGVDGLFDPPVKAVYEEPGYFPGARYLSHRILRRDITFAVIILNDAAYGGSSWLSRDSEWRKAWAFDRDCTLHITTEASGRRSLKVRLLESPKIDFFTDPSLPQEQLKLAVMTCVSGDPFWYEDDVVYTAVTKKDTRSSTTLSLLGSKPLPTESLSITVDPSDGKGGLNPTDTEIWPKWTVPGCGEQIPTFPWPWPAGIAIPWDTAPFIQWTVPDYSFQADDQAARRLTLPGLVYKEDCVIDTDPRVEQISSAIDTPVWSRMNGVRFVNFVPPYTRDQKFQIDVSGCAPGQMITLRLPRPWSRPWGLE